MATNHVYTVFTLQQAEAVQDLATDTLKIALFSSAYAPNRDTDVTFSSLTGELATSGGYTAGGVALSGVTVTQDNTNHRTVVTATNPSWTVTSTLTYQTVVLYDSSKATNNLICYWDFGANQTTGSSGTYTLNFDASNGAIYLAAN